MLAVLAALGAGLGARGSGRRGARVRAVLAAGIRSSPERVSNALVVAAAL